ncbi:hypothetical protein AX15_001256 [Amanita polypyramis BW_CC]|nr:hypothetical protein AX15_001256 [Amanita polypyramis BW_CC]
MNSSAILPSRPIHSHLPARCPNHACSTPLEFPVPSPSPRPGSPLHIRCFACQSIFSYPFQPNLNPPWPPSSSQTTPATIPTPPPGSSQKKTRLIGTQERPLESEYYDLLSVPPTATLDEIKKAYRRLAIKHHPDKNLSDPSAAERFKHISIAYQTLSDPVLRKRYNEFGAKAGTPEGGYMDPEEVFGTMFGGERFVPIIGNISLAKEMKAAMQEGDEEDENASDLTVDPSNKSGTSISATTTTTGDRKRDLRVLSPEEKAAKEEKARKKAAERAAAREERISKLVDNLDRKLAIFTESASGPNDREVTNSWKKICQLEAEELVRESYGYELLQTIGFVYLSKAKHHLASHQTLLGIGGWLHNVQSKYHVFSETVSTLRSAIELKSVFDQLQAAEKAGTLSPQERKKLEEQATEKGLQALFKGTKLEVESVLREVCDRVLGIGSEGVEKAVMRAIALQIIGEAYMAVKRDPNAPGLGGLYSGPGAGGGGGGGGGGAGGMGDDSEYVKVETKASRDRARASYADSSTAMA